MVVTWERMGNKIMNAVVVAWADLLGSPVGGTWLDEGCSHGLGILPKSKTTFFFQVSRLPQNPQEYTLPKVKSW